MNRRGLIVSCIAIFSVVLAVYGQTAGTQGQPSNSPATSVSPQRAVLDQYCVGCHNQRAKAAGLPQGVLTLDNADLARVGENAEVWEKVVRRLRAGMMPPVGARRPPDSSTLQGLAVWLENEIDRNAVTHVPAPGLHRLNRTEYANVIRDLLALEVDVTKLLPSDDSTYGFDNIAGALSMSSTLLEAYVSAAEKISRLAIGDVSTPAQAVYRAPEDTSQDYHIEGLPFGTRGGMLIKHEFPADGEYMIKVVPISKGNMGNTNPFGEIAGEKLEILLDGERLALLNFGGGGGFGGGPRPPLDVRFPAKAGLHNLGVTFLATHYAPVLDLNKHFLRSTLETGGLPGFTFFPHVGSVRIDGPYSAAGAGDTASRRKIFVCRPANAPQEPACAREIVSALARRAYRRPATTAEVDELMAFYQSGREDGNFDTGIQMALQRILADPRFIYRIETEPANVAAGQTYRVSDLELASRLSFFLWSTSPDDELINLASQGKLKDSAVLEQQVRRMLADPRSEALAINFAGQWLNLRGMQSVGPLPMLYPDFDDNLRQAFRREAELFFDSIVRENRSVLDLLTADHTFVNERLAKHYGIPHIYGSQFQRVTLGPALDARRGLLGKGAILTTTSQPARTSPVTRGKWILTNLIGVKPPDPPPNVPELKTKANDATGNVKEPSMRQKMLDHRVRADCVQCHKLMDPIGFALENFDGIALWRTHDEGNLIDASDVLYDGARIDGPAGLRQWLLGHSDQFVRTVTEKLLTYALGRGAEYHDMPVVRSIVRDTARDNYRFSSLVMGVVKSEPFQMNMRVQGNSDND